MNNLYPNSDIDKYFVMTIICSGCQFMYPLPSEIEGVLQECYINLPGLLSMEIEMSAMKDIGNIAFCPSCKEPTILQIKAINKNG